MRLFAGVWVPTEVSRLLASVERPELPGIRWTTPDQWHVTLAFIGDVAEEAVAPMEAALADAAIGAAAPPEAVMGPGTAILGREVLCVPVAGLEEMASAVQSALGSVTDLPGAGDKPYSGHLTLARARRRHSIPRRLAGTPLDARWAVRELCLVRSELAPDGARYTTLARATVRS